MESVIRDTHEKEEESMASQSAGLIQLEWSENCINAGRRAFTPQAYDSLIQLPKRVYDYTKTFFHFIFVIVIFSRRVVKCQLVTRFSFDQRYGREVR